MKASNATRSPPQGCPLSSNEETPPIPFIVRPPLISRKCARKSKPTALILPDSLSDDSDSGSVSEASDDRPVSPPNVDDDEIQIIPNPNIPPHELVKVTGFYLACKRTGIKTDARPQSRAPEVDIFLTIQPLSPIFLTRQSCAVGAAPSAISTIPSRRSKCC
ncbi:hypothetical protein BDZ89DRAFT_762780 [Hymenopellis radicata]|nr:hypothetical protein BDZ89DRAFT_762780 [Hymenopellis radicata]